MIEAAETTPPPATGSGGVEPSPVSAPARPTMVEKPPLATAPVSEPPADTLVATPELPPVPAETGTRWWLWGSIAAAVAVGAAVAVYALWPPGTTTLHEGSLGTLRR